MGELSNLMVIGFWREVSLINDGFFLYMVPIILFILNL